LTSSSSTDKTAAAAASASSQMHNPFNAAVRAPASWFNLLRSITEGVLCAHTRTHTCVFVFEYDLEYGRFLRLLAEDVAGSSVFTTRAFPAGVSIGGYMSAKPVFTAVWWDRFPSVTTPAVCCEVHALMPVAAEYACRMQHSALATSGHLTVMDLARHDDASGLWDELIRDWRAGVVTTPDCKLERKRKL
jgi:hypothetical protein